jgi:glutathione synthase/RimK-type ligase-like ATP-grasp enzyme
MGMPLVNPVEAVTIARNKFLTQQVLTPPACPAPTPSSSTTRRDSFTRWIAWAVTRWW